MPKYIAKPVVVEAFKIHTVSTRKPDGFGLILENGDAVHATNDMCSRMEPKVGDYWVIQSDGYIYLNPKEVFERKYHATI